MIDYGVQAQRILELVGGKDNIISLTHCFTRLRFVLKNPESAKTEELRELEGIQGVLKRPGSYQIVIGLEAGGFFKALEPLCRTEG